MIFFFNWNHSFQYTVNTFTYIITRATFPNNGEFGLSISAVNSFVERIFLSRRVALGLLFIGFGLHWGAMIPFGAFIHLLLTSLRLYDSLCSFDSSAFDIIAAL
ncbi:hypothetical protein BALCAV_0219385 [Alkalihalobacillus alcalophilus ATCC 27647 = CGMCC 1.3604]|uniref:Uncharacterized protein n=1 Tax=Alkalihalobacillus alcalophilus ATCC 27647 = CGMCC 1.3604 TaxID=1218173 RepID=A0A094XAX7_ALKAL|nr:hypothetical protein BALCAV_0219385 [Alkalihalobacillus alcalophilus ATCC 27647 = CGMCC 1.3604]